MDGKMKINTPDRLKHKLTGNYDEAVTHLENTISDILTVGDQFFYNYTEHGVPHINKVLELADMLIPNETMDTLSEKDICLLVMAIIVHDIGMFIHYPGLRKLLTDEQWRDKWDQYRRELNHMSESEMGRIFGKCGGSNGRSLPKAADIVAVERNAFELEWHKRLCGEFLRRHHHELAEYIVNNGFPVSIDEDYTNLFDKIDMGTSTSRYKRLIGLIAKSHGESLDIYYNMDQGICGRTPIYYLMSVLRLADLLDVGEDRAPWINLQIRGIDAEISKTELTWNRFVNLSEWNTESEVLKVYVESEIYNMRDILPISSSIFLKIESWMRYVQQELDMCWRYITHFYNSQKGKEYRLSIRIIESNILDLQQRKAFSEKIVLKPAKLSASPDIFGLLTTPLYGDHVTYGVRELLQNAVDACRERRAIEGEEYKGLVTVNVDKDAKGEKLFTITDNGIGMTEDVILNYFLKAGSTYRNSDEWKMKYGEKGVIRNGQFGIGVLAAFILGDEVRVSTVPRGSTIGYRFAMRRDDYGTIDIARESFAKDSELRSGGTRIEVAIKNQEDVWKFPDTKIDTEKDQNERWSDIWLAMFYYGSPLSPFMWYWPDSMENPELPTVEYRLFGTKLVAPIALDQVSEWFELPPIEGIKRIQWWKESPDRGSINIWYNHLYVHEIAYDARIWYAAHFPVVSAPQLLNVVDAQKVMSMEDSKKHCAVNLERTELRLPITAEIALYIENVKLFLAMLMMARISDEEQYEFFLFGLKISPHGIDCLFSKHGYAMQNYYVAEYLKEKTIWLVVLDNPYNKVMNDAIPDGDDVYIFRRSFDSALEAFTSKRLIPYNEITRVSVTASNEKPWKLPDRHVPDVINLKQCLEKDYDTFIESADRGDQIRTLSVDGFFDKLSYRTDNYRACVEGAERFFTLFDRDAGERFTRLDIPKVIMKQADWSIEFKIVDSRQGLGSDQPDELREMDERIMELLKYYFEHDAGKDPWIPYDPKERRTKFPRFFDPEDDMYKYMKYVDRHRDRDEYYALRDFGTEEA